MKDYKYLIVLFCNKKKEKVFYRAQTEETIYKFWKELKKRKKPKYVKIQGKKRNQELIYELALIFPNSKSATITYVKDSLGRLIESKLSDNTHRIKAILPYWEEELIYDFETKKRIRFDELIEKITNINDIAQIFTLNNKLFVQVEDTVTMYGNKNVNDSNRLFELIREEILLIKKMGNFIFVRDISTTQRKNLYVMLENMGFNRKDLFRHYSY